MKIGILTFHCAHNYGAVLQTYALQQYLKSIGHEVYVLDYRPDFLTRGYKPSLSLSFSGKSLKRFLNNFYTQLLTGRYLRKRYSNFSNFINNRLNLKKYNSELTDIDYIFLGSDQIWSPEITGKKFDDNYFAYNANCKIVSYAASSNKTSFTPEEQGYLKRMFKRFFAISVREESLRAIIQECSTIPVKCVLDPTFLPGKSCFEDLASDSLMNKDYILVFELNLMDNLRKMGRELGKQTNSRVIYLTGYPYISRVHNSLTDISPEEMLSLFKNAKCIITSSFHGTAFSLIFNKPFFTVKKNSPSDKRMESLLNKLGLLDRFIDITDMPTYSKIDYGKVNPLLAKEVQESKNFINEALKS